MKRSPLGVEQVGAFAAGALGDEYAVGLEGGGMVLHHLHVHQRRPGTVGQCHPVAGTDQGIRARLEDAAEAAGAEDDRFRTEQLQPTTADLQGKHPTQAPSSMTRSVRNHSS